MKLLKIYKRIIVKLLYFILINRAAKQEKSNFSIKKDIKFIIIGSIHRSGGSLLNQLFDGHENLASYPQEFIYWNPKNIWTPLLKKKSFTKLIQPINDYKMLKCIYYKNYDKYKVIKKNSGIEFLFDIKKFKKLYNIQKNLGDDKNILIDYFNCFFKSWSNLYKYHIQNIYYISLHTPGLILNKHSINYIRGKLDNSLLVFTVRDPKSIFNSLFNKNNKSNPESVKDDLTKYYENIIFYHKNENVIIISYNDLIDKPEVIMKYLCKKLSINFAKSLLTPTFNRKKIKSNSSYQRFYGVKKSNNNGIDFYNNLLTQIQINNLEKLYKKVNYLCHH